MTLWTPEALAVATGGQLLNNPGPVTGIAIDNREVIEGDLFLALKGDNHDGHAFAAKALEAGAAAVLVHSTDGLPEGAPTVLVEDSMEALQALGHAGRSRFQGKVIGVTGSVGKTSTKDMLAVVLAQQGKTHAATRSFNNHWGVPLTLARMPADAAFAVIEIGMNHPGEITPLSQMARPHVALITTVEAVHLEAFESVEQIADAKAEIFTGLEPGGCAVLPADNPHIGRLVRASAGCNAVGFGTSAKGYRLVSVEVGTSTKALAESGGRQLRYSLATRGAHFAMNALGALAAVEVAGADLERAVRDLSRWSPTAGRGSVVNIPIPGGQITLLDESYNANPASMGAALAVLAATDAKGRRLAFLGDMLELGPTEDALHAGLATHAAIAGIDFVHCCGSRMEALHAALPVDKRGICCANSDELAQQVGKAVDAGDVCMVKGSLGARMVRVVEAIRRLGVEAPSPSEGT